MPERQERKDAAEHRQLILKTAEELFDRHGVHAVSMHQIAKSAGVGQGTLYRRYSHKGDLCLDIIKDFSSHFVDSVKLYLKENKSVSPEERLGYILDLWVDTIEKKSELIMTIQAHQLKNCEENRAATFFQSPLYRFIRTVMSDLLAEMAANRQDSGADPTLTAHGLICSMSPHGHFYVKLEQGYSTEQMKNNYRHMCRLPSIKKE